MNASSILARALALPLLALGLASVGCSSASSSGPGVYVYALTSQTQARGSCDPAAGVRSQEVPTAYFVVRTQPLFSTARSCASIAQCLELGATDAPAIEVTPNDGSPAPWRLFFPMSMSFTNANAAGLCAGTFSEVTATGAGGQTITLERVEYVIAGMAASPDGTCPVDRTREHAARTRVCNVASRVTGTLVATK